MKPRTSDELPVSGTVLEDSMVTDRLRLFAILSPMSYPSVRTSCRWNDKRVLFVFGNQMRDGLEDRSFAAQEIGRMTLEFPARLTRHSLDSQ